MKRFAWQWVVVSSILLMQAAEAVMRPQYGGTLRVAMREAPVSLDPSTGGADVRSDSFAQRNLLALIFETLVTVDDRGRLHPGLATDWQAAPGNQRWQFRLRRGVRFHDGAPLTAEIAAGSLRTANPSWKVFTEGDSVIVERDKADPDLPAELALTRNSILKRNSAGKLNGTGPFHIEDWLPGKKLTLVAEEDQWRGRAFVDKLEIEMGINLHEQLVELETGKADLVEVAPEQGHRATMEGRRVSSLQPMELVALVFANDALTSDEQLLRRALADSLERSSMRSALLQGAGQPAASILPNWMGGYGFIFSSDAELDRARHERAQVRSAPNWTVGYDANDSVARLLVERIALNAKDARACVAADFTGDSRFAAGADSVGDGGSVDRAVEGGRHSRPGNAETKRRYGGRFVQRRTGIACGPARHSAVSFTGGVGIVADAARLEARCRRQLAPG